MTATRTASIDVAIAAVVLSRTPLYYREGAEPALDRPAHVRAGSSMAWVPGGIAVVQDDANFLAVHDPDIRRTWSIALPAGEEGRRQFDDGRGNKKYKLDLEACVSIEREGDTILLALGSGSSERRDQAVIVRDWTTGSPAVSVVELPRLYESLRRTTAFAGSELNVEGAVVLGDRLRLFGRGNGAPRDGVPATSATCDLNLSIFLEHVFAPDRNPAPQPENVVRYDLGALGGIALGFTDAASWRDGVLYSATAEDSPDVTRDGRVAGSAIGFIDAAGTARWTQIIETSGEPFVGKVEGLLVSKDAPDRLFVVGDDDDPDAPSSLLLVELRGAW